MLHIFGFEMELSARLWAKLVSSVAVVIANYFISKLVVFRRKQPPAAEKRENRH